MIPLYQFKKLLLQFESTYMEPLLKYDQEHPIPKFHVDPCKAGGGDGDHIDSWWCCSQVSLTECIDWFEKTQLPFGFKHEHYNCFESKGWPYKDLSKRYEKSKEDQHVQTQEMDQDFLTQEMVCSDTDCKHCTIL